MTQSEIESALSGPMMVAMQNSGDNAMTLSGKLIDKVRDLLSEIDLPPREVVLNAVRNVYAQYVAPVDLPGVPNAIEPWVDQAILAIVLRAVNGMYDRIENRQ